MGQKDRQQVKAFAAKFDHLSLVPGTHIMEEKQPPSYQLIPACAYINYNYNFVIKNAVQTCNKKAE